jgi:hypothetical protein
MHCRCPTRCCAATSAARAWAPGCCTVLALRAWIRSPRGAARVRVFPLVGTPLTTGAKFAVVAKSPLTGLLTDALASRQFAIAGKLTGHDAIVVTGRAASPSVLLVDGDGARLRAAPDLAGLTAADADRKLRDQLGRGWRVAAIGPAGERGVRYATISHDGRHAGRGGLGAVMGAKNLKAIAVRAATKVSPAGSGRRAPAQSTLAGAGATSKTGTRPVPAGPAGMSAARSSVRPSASLGAVDRTR